ncbi:MAG TPA: GYF domain-containing protein [Kofleriaceae bacterium]|nr:GYF domain-containing protein [Kofleriaceae bacterium]
MKFLCDRCKTRYSIGDERVRGKILKIRCKNCANVITVREGMGEPAADESARRGRPTTQAPNASHTAPANGAASQTKPPPALEEEWYVSIDGDQAGPYSLAEAQRWVAAKPFDAELHCWSEGFDDWLPVDKVSHFRGLRKRPAPAPAPPPLPRAAPRLGSTATDDEPKPLFAATMATLEKSAGVAAGASDRGLGLPSITSAQTAKGMPAVPAIAKTNGSSAVTAKPARPTPVPQPAMPGVKSPAAGVQSPAAGMPGVKIPAPGVPAGSGPNRTATAQGVGGAPSAGAQALAAAFDTGDAGDSMTAVEPPPFGDELGAAAESIAARLAQDRSETARGEPEPGNEDEGLEIGEVSRVVKLADLAKMSSQRERKTSRPPLARTTGSLRATGSTPKLSAAEVGLAAVPEMAGGEPAPAAAADAAAAAPVQVQRRGMIMLLAVAGVLLLGVVGAVIWIVSSSSDDIQTGLGRTSQIDTSRPEDIIRRIVTQGTGSGSATPTVRPPIHHGGGGQIRTGGGTGDETPSDPTKRQLDPGEVEDMANKQSEATNFCYARAMHGALGIEIADVRKIAVTLNIDKEGAVNEVQLSDHGGDSFGKCLAARIKGWKFRQSSAGGVFKITLAFSSG